MKIAVYSGEIPSTTFIEVLIKSLATHGHTVYLFGKRKKMVQYAQRNIFIHPTSEGMVAYLYVFWHALRLRLQHPERYFRLKTHINQQGLTNIQRWRKWASYLPVILHLPDIFHLQWAKGVGEWYFLKEYFGVKLVLSLRGAHINYSPVADPALAQTYRRYFPQVDAFHAVSKAIVAESLQYGVLPEKASVVYSGIDSQKIKPHQKTTYVLQNPVSLISVGRFHWKKGYHYALDAMYRLQQKGIDVHYTIIAGEAPEEVLYQLADLGLEGSVTVLGQMPQAEVFKRMQQSDILLLPSVEEGIANVVLEAMAIGLPVICSDCGGMSEVVDHGVNGLLFPQRDVAGLAACIREMIVLPSTARQAMAYAAIAKVESQHRVDRLEEEMAQLYSTATCG